MTDAVWVDYATWPAGEAFDQAIYRTWCDREDGSRYTGGTKRKFSRHHYDALWLLEHVRTMTGCRVSSWWNYHTRMEEVDLEYIPDPHPNHWAPGGPDPWAAHGEGDTFALAVCRAVMDTENPDSEAGEDMAWREFLRDLHVTH